MQILILDTLIDEVLTRALNDPNEAFIEYLIKLRCKLILRGELSIIGTVVHQSFEFYHLLVFDRFEALSEVEKVS